MITVPLGELARIVSGATPRTNIPEYWGGDVRWVTPADLSKLQGAYVSDTPRNITQAGLRSCAATILPAGSVLLSSRAPIGHVAINTVPMATNQGFKSLVLGPRLDAKFAYHWLKSQTEYLQSLGNGATFKEVSKAIVERVEIPLPPLDEQRRIAAILDAAADIRNKRRQTLVHLDAFVDASFLRAFGNPLAPVARAQRVPLGSVAKVVTGNSPSRADAANFGDNIEWIKSDNLGGDLASTAEEGLSERGRSKARVAPAGSLLVTCIAGSPTSIGKCSMVDRQVAFNQQINAVLPSDALSIPFLQAQLKVAPALVRQKSSGGMKGLVSKSSFESIEVLLPPRVDQDEFTSLLERVRTYRSRAEAALAADDELFASLQARAFSGALI